MATRRHVHATRCREALHRRSRRAIAARPRCIAACARCIAGAVSARSPSLRRRLDGAPDDAAYCILRVRVRSLRSREQASCDTRSPRRDDLRWFHLAPGGAASWSTPLLFVREGRFGYRQHHSGGEHQCPKSVRTFMLRTTIEEKSNRMRETGAADDQCHS